MSTPTAKERRAWCAVAAGAASLATGFIAEESKARHTITWEEKSLTDFVSRVDIGAEEIVRRHFAQEAPEIRVVGEEQGGGATDIGLVAIVDPLDGTTNFLHGYPAYAVSICVALDGVPQAAAIVDVARGGLYNATLGGGAFVDDQPIRVSTINHPPRALIGTGFPFKDQRFAADSAKPAQWNSGAYLATALGHCGECHTPRNLMYGLDHHNELAGASQQGWRAFNITSDTTHGIGSWSDADIAGYLTTAHADGRGSAGGPMGEAVSNSLQYLTPQDTAALVAYLRSVPARTGTDPVDMDATPALAMSATAMAPAANTSSTNEQGLRLFSGACASCHQWNGQGPAVASSSLLGLRSVNDPQGLNVSQMILDGVDMHVHGAAIYMPAFGNAYSDTEVAALANYVIAQFGNKQGLVTPAFVAAQRKSKPS